MTIKLRVIADKLARPLPLAALRDKLGGLAAPCERAGEAVGVAGRATPGVLLDVDGERAHVWLGDGRVLRVAAADLSSTDGDLPPALAVIAAHARAFSAIRDGARVSFRSDNGDGEGVVADRCRFGVVVARADGSMLGVGFTRVAPSRSDA